MSFPFAVPAWAFAFAVAALLGWGMVRWRASRLPDAAGSLAGTLFVDALIVGLLAARLGYVLRWWPEYRAHLLSVFAIGDGGFLWWSGLPAAVAFAWWRTAERVSLRRPLLAGLVAGMLAWAGAAGMVVLLRHAAPPLPGIALSGLDGRPQRLDAHAGRPVVVNLWATWCPPCRREMPVLAQAQRSHPGVAIVLVNQGETADEIRDFLAREKLAVDNVLLDPHSQAMQAVGARGLPTTLFYARDGRLLDVHMGELTRAALDDKLRRRFGDVSSASMDETP